MAYFDYPVVGPNFGIANLTAGSITPFSSPLVINGGIRADGRSAINQSPASGSQFSVGGTGLMVGQTTQTGISSNVVSDTTNTANLYGYSSNATTTAAAYTLALRASFISQNAARGAGSTITRDVSFYLTTPNQGNNNAGIADNTSFNGGFFINSTTTNPSVLTGALCQARFDVASAATITALNSTRSFVKLTGATATSLQGITAGIDGQGLRLVNLTGQNMTVANENAGATAADRITTMTGADVLTTANGAAEFVYDTGSSRWICLFVTA